MPCSGRGRGNEAALKSGRQDGKGGTPQGRDVKTLHSTIDSDWPGEDTARLARERDEALEREKAIAEVLRVISSSPGDLQIVLHTLVQSAARLCEADHAWLFRRDGEVYRWAASYGHSKEEHGRLKQYMLTSPFSPGRGSATARSLLERRPVQIAEIPIIAVTSYALDGQEKIARAAGCDDYVPKPYSPRELLAKIRQHLS